MKKIVFILVFSAAFAIGHAQEGNNICVWNAMNTYNGGGAPDDLERGIKCSDEAINNEATSVKSKTWFYRGELYTLVFIDTILKKKYPASAFEAIKAFNRLRELADPKFKEWDDVLKYLYPLATNTFNEGVEQFQNNRNYAQAYQYFYAIKDINAIIEGRGKTANIELATALKNAAICAENAGDVNGSIKVYQDWIAIAPNVVAYKGYALALKKSGKTAEAEKVIDEGLTKFNKDANLLVEKINFLIAKGEQTQALAFVNNLLEVDPKNSGALFVKGSVYEKIGNQDSVVYYYEKAIEANPKNSDALHNLGALYVNKANALVEPMNKLGNTGADVQKYNDLKKQRKDLFLKAKPYLLRAQEIDPNDAQITRTLKQIEMLTTE